MNFASDNTAGAHPDIMTAIVRANDGRTMPYGHDDGTEAARQRVCEVFETDAKVFFVPTGTAADRMATLRAEGWITVAGLDGDADADAQGEARRLGCTHWLHDGRPAPIGEA